MEGPSGIGQQKWVRSSALLPYVAHFENLPGATAWATKIDVVDQIDPALDLASLQLGELQFSGHSIQIPQGLTHFSKRIQMEPAFGNLFADVNIDVDAATRTIHWTIQAIDPATGAPPESPDLGLLPPEDGTGLGQGYVSYTIKPKSDAPTGAVISNKATIVFDDLESIDTNTWTNTLDSGPPSSVIASLPAVTGAPFAVAWDGTDDAGGSGVGSYDIFVSDNGGPYDIWLSGTTDPAATFTGELNHTYRFYSRARDNVGNYEDAPADPDAVTTVVVMAPADPSPADGAVNLPVTSSLSWTPGAGALYHDLYLWPTGLSKPASPTATALTNLFVPSSLNYLHEYNWQVVAVGPGASASGPQWKFTTISQIGESLLSGAKRLPDGTPVQVKDLVVTAIFSGCFYAQRLDNSMGVRVNYSGVVAQGDTVDILGHVGTTADDERCIDAIAVARRAPAGFMTVYLGGMAVGGSDYDYDAIARTGQRGVVAYRHVLEDGQVVRKLGPMWGLNNIGLFVLTAGTVRQAAGSHIVVDDGSRVDDGNAEMPGLKVELPAGTPLPAVGATVTVKGVVSCTKIDGLLYRSLKVWRTEDLVVHSGGNIERTGTK